MLLNFIYFMKLNTKNVKSIIITVAISDLVTV